MIELTPNQARCGLLGMFDIDTAEHYGYYDELFALDFKTKNDVVYAINKWLKPVMNERASNRVIEANKIKEGLRRLITMNKLPATRHDMPGWETVPPDEFASHAKNFSLWLWETLYEEPFVPADLNQYRIRIDKSFVENPNDPALWGTPEYSMDE